MKFVTNISKDKYDNFVENSNKPHFLQSYTWGEFSKLEKNLIPHYVGLEDNEKLVATALILEKKLPLNLSYFYIPRGYTIDYNNKDLLKEFTNYIKEYAKSKKAIFIKIDPDMIYHSEDNNGNVIKENDNSIINNLKSIGFKHLGFTKNFETMQPRYSFRIDMNKPYEEIENNFSKTTKQRIKKANDLDVSVRIGDINDINTFYNLMILTENRKDFITHNEKYYKTLYELEKDKCNLFLGSVNIENIIKILEDKEKSINEELNTLPKEELSKSQKSKKQELEKQLDKIISDLNNYRKAKDEYGNNIVLSAHFIIEYGNMAWVLYAGNHNILTETYTNYKTYENHIKYYYDKGMKVYDQFGTIGDLRKDNPLLGLHEFKKKFGGDYVEFIGEFDLITNKFMYFIFTKLVPIYRNIIKKSAKKKRGM